MNAICSPLSAPRPSPCSRDDARFRWQSRWWAPIAGAILTMACVGMTGCRQNGVGTSVHPMTTLPGAPPAMAAPSFQGLNPFGSGVRIPPPNPQSISPQAMANPPNGYAPTGYSNNTGNGNDPANPSYPNGSGFAVGSGVAPVGYVENSPYPPAPASVDGGTPNSYRGGMPVIDLTAAPPPPGYAGSGANLGPGTNMAYGQPPMNVGATRWSDQFVGQAVGSASGQLAPSHLSPTSTSAPGWTGSGVGWTGSGVSGSSGGWTASPVQVGSNPMRSFKPTSGD